MSKGKLNLTDKIVNDVIKTVAVHIGCYDNFISDEIKYKNNVHENNIEIYALRLRDDKKWDRADQEKAQKITDTDAHMAIYSNAQILTGLIEFFIEHTYLQKDNTINKNYIEANAKKHGVLELDPHLDFLSSRSIAANKLKNDLQSMIGEAIYADISGNAVTYNKVKNLLTNAISSEEKVENKPEKKASEKARKNKEDKSIIPPYKGTSNWSTSVKTKNDESHTR